MDPRVKPAGDGFVVRKEIKGHGTERKIDANFKPDSNVILSLPWSEATVG
jgi:orotate phosphoribosyltransferase